MARIKIRYITLQLIIFLSVSLTQCHISDKKDAGGDIWHINIEKSNDKDNIKLSTLVDSIRYVKLEFTSACPIRKINNIYFDDKHLLVNGDDIFYLFSNTGKFIRRIGRKGKGPGEYLLSLFTIPDLRNNVFYLYDNYLHQLICYGLDGKYHGTSVRFPDYLSNAVLTDSTIVWVEGAFRRIDNPGNNIPIAYRTNFQNDTLCFFESFYYNHVVNKFAGQGVFGIDNFLYMSDTIPLVQEAWCDTIYRFTQCQLKPYIIIDQGSKKIPFEYEPFTSPNHKSRLRLHILGESIRYIFLGNFPCGVLDKKTNQFSILPISGKTKRTTLYEFENDLDGGISFWPKQVEQGCMIYWVDVGEFIDKMAKAKGDHINAGLNDQLNKITADIEENDNPIIMFAYLKK